MRSRHDRLKAQQKIKEEFGYTPEIAPYLAAAEERKQWPDYVKAKIEKCVEYILERHPSIKGLHLIGSYAAGTYIDENTPDDFKELKRKAGARVKLSDFDFETEPRFTESWVTPEGYLIHLWVAQGGDRINLEYLLSYD